ncbi:MAG TPA: hypothetical protein VHM91_17090 [Verrucomicrobiales bacterium]|jgi:hypothetical protein|nr:hypothetical protein [Verrucomicrobiales bacterium]
MAFSVVSKKSGKTYHLHLKEQKRADGGITKLYFFGGEVKEGALDKLPDGYKVIENERTGLPMLKKK